MKLVVDASVAVGMVTSEPGLVRLRSHELIAPRLMWSEALSVLHVGAWRGEVAVAKADTLRERLEKIPVARKAPRGLLQQAWQIADELGVARTYDAEYLALARIEGGKVITIDAKMRRGADRLGLVILPTEL